MVAAAQQVPHALTRNVSTRCAAAQLLVPIAAAVIRLGRVLRVRRPASITCPLEAASRGLAMALRALLVRNAWTRCVWRQGVAQSVSEVTAVDAVRWAPVLGA